MIVVMGMLVVMDVSVMAVLMGMGMCVAVDVVMIMMHGEFSFIVKFVLLLYLSRRPMSKHLFPGKYPPTGLAQWSKIRYNDPILTQKEVDQFGRTAFRSQP